MIFPFYEKARALFIKTQDSQIRKGLQKYPEPFNPHSWTPDELLNHALEEAVDLTHYLVGLKELINAKDEEIRRLTSELEQLRSKDFFRDTPLSKIIERPGHIPIIDIIDIPVRVVEGVVRPTINFDNHPFIKEEPKKPHKYFDSDDQHI